MLTGTLPKISNQATWSDNLEFYDDASGQAWFTQSDASTHPDEVTFNLRDDDVCKTVLSGSLSGGDLVITGDGIIQFTFANTKMQSVCPKTYTVGVLYTKNGVVSQVILGRVPVIRGL